MSLLFTLPIGLIDEIVAHLNDASDFAHLEQTCTRMHRLLVGRDCEPAIGAWHRLFSAVFARLGADNRINDVGTRDVMCLHSKYVPLPGPIVVLRTRAPCVAWKRACAEYARRIEAWRLYISCGDGDAYAAVVARISQRQRHLQRQLVSLPHPRRVGSSLLLFPYYVVVVRCAAARAALQRRIDAARSAAS